MRTNGLIWAESKTGYIYEPKKAVNRVVELSGVPFTLHDLRRTFHTDGNELEFSLYGLGGNFLVSKKLFD